MDLASLLGDGPAGVDVTSLALDSRRVGPGTLFFCVPGFERDGHDFGPAAAAAGAAALVVERRLDGLDLPQVVVSDVRACMGAVASRFHGSPSRSGLEVVGITGTAGKTSTTALVHAMLEAAGVSCGLVGTSGALVGGTTVPSVRTTPEAVDLQALFADMLAAGDRACAMEVSSHAIELGRSAGTRFAVAGFTNLSQDHLDFHPTMDAYFAAKARLFEGEYDVGTRIVCVDDEWGRRLPADLTVSVGASADYRAVSLEPHPAGTRFTVLAPDGPVQLESPLVGSFNVANVTLAAACVRALDIPWEPIADAVERFAGVPGRLEAVDAGQPFAVLVDYAHKPGALEQVLHAAREAASPNGGRVLLVVGAGGDRDRGKRPVMGEIAGRLADWAVVTSDNPRTEDPEAIVDEVLGTTQGLLREVDRRAAIGLAVREAQAGDVLVVAGKGDETGQQHADRTEEFDDRVVAREALQDAGYGAPVNRGSRA